jgi:hypothetical protein
LPTTPIENGRGGEPNAYDDLSFSDNGGMALHPLSGDPAGDGSRRDEKGSLSERTLT